jgi:hypothetical protein
MLRYALLIRVQHDDFSIGIRACSMYNFAFMDLEKLGHDGALHHGC